MADWPCATSSFSATTCAAMSKWSSSTHCAPIVSSTTFWRNRWYCSSAVSTRSRRSAIANCGSTSQTPTIIIRLASVSMRSQAVSTRDIRSTFSLKKSPVFSRLECCLGTLFIRAARLVFNIRPVKPDFHPQRNNSHEHFERAIRASGRGQQEPARASGQHDDAEDPRAVQAGQRGDVDGKRPGFTDMVGRAKWDAWNELKGQTQDEAKQAYVDLIEDLK